MYGRVTHQFRGRRTLSGKWMPDDHIGRREVAMDYVRFVHLGDFRPDQPHDFICTRQVETRTWADASDPPVVTWYSSRGST